MLFAKKTKILLYYIPIKEAEISETFSPRLGINTFYYLQNKRNMSHFTKKCNSFHFTQTLKNLNCPELWIPFVFSKRNSFKKGQKQVVTTKLFMNVHFCSLGMKTYGFQLVNSQKLPCTKVTLQEKLPVVRCQSAELDRGLSLSSDHDKVNSDSFI